MTIKNRTADAPLGALAVQTLPKCADAVMPAPPFKTHGGHLWHTNFFARCFLRAHFQMALLLTTAAQLIALQTHDFIAPFDVTLCHGAVALRAGTMRFPSLQSALMLLTATSICIGGVTDMLLLRLVKSRRANDTCDKLLRGVLQVGFLFLIVFGTIEVLNMTFPDPKPELSQRLDAAAVAVLAAHNLSYAPQFGTCAQNISVLQAGVVPAGCQPWCSGGNASALLCVLPAEFAVPNAFLRTANGAAYLACLACMGISVFVYACVAAWNKS